MDTSAAGSRVAVDRRFVGSFGYSLLSCIKPHSISVIYSIRVGGSSVADVGAIGSRSGLMLFMVSEGSWSAAAGVITISGMVVFVVSEDLVRERRMWKERGICGRREKDVGGVYWKREEEKVMGDAWPG
jgi:hypothetical protein